MMGGEDDGEGGLSLEGLNLIDTPRFLLAEGGSLPVHLAAATLPRWTGPAPPDSETRAPNSPITRGYVRGGSLDLGLWNFSLATNEKIHLSFRNVPLKLRRALLRALEP